MRILSNLFFIFFLQIIPHLVVGQQETFYQPKKFPDKIPEQYIFNSAQEYNRLIAHPVKGIRERDYKRFAEEVTYGKSEMFNNGGVYLNWPELEDYLNKVLQRILPDSLKNKKNVHVYAGRDADYNAYAIYDGSFFFNIGTMATVANEAALAIILGHELGHYIYQDSRNSYIKNLKLYTKSNRNKDNLKFKIGRAHEDRFQESRCDSLGFILANKAGYNVKYGFNNFYTFMEIDKKNDDQKETAKIVNVGSSEKKGKTNKIDSLLASHPGNIERIEYLKKYIKGLKTKNSGTDFIIDKKAFDKARREARLESLDILLTDLHPISCAELAFSLYLIEPENKQNVYYLLEAIRRLLFVKPAYRKKGFLTEKYAKAFKKGEGILHNLSFLIRDSTTYAAIKATALKDTSKIEFETYQQAFTYFSKIAQKYSITESLLTIALHTDSNQALRKELLFDYIASKNCRYPEYAKTLLANKLAAKNTNTKELVIMNDITFREDHYYGYHDRLILADMRSPKYLLELKEMMAKKFPEKELVTLDGITKSDFKKSMEYRYALATTFYLFNTSLDDESDDDNLETGVIHPEGYVEEFAKEDSVKPEQLFVLDPAFWYLFKDNKLKSLELLDVVAFDDKTKITNLLNTLNPIYWYFIFYQFAEKYSVGSLRYGFKVSYYSFSPSQDQNIYSSKTITHYKMYKGYFLNEIFYAFKNRDKK
jgi:Zn-dependent protease with chaperone function